MKKAEEEEEDPGKVEENEKSLTPFGAAARHCQHTPRLGGLLIFFNYVFGRR